MPIGYRHVDRRFPPSKRRGDERARRRTSRRRRTLLRAASEENLRRDNQRSESRHLRSLQYPSTAFSLQSTIVHSIRVGISEVKLCTSIGTWCSEILFQQPKLARDRSRE
ncbi:hypothetical protein EVAR_102175_1 [Eumeta japonica]|uniref:Uncharacterized protein n=1 Tax=Eumeta variegata TaxID=151549 RepID=A0A4C1ZEY2_EUMVA|nr:hypothetical protein EVAR_102175_1 [Eumeta japonica]